MAFIAGVVSLAVVGYKDLDPKGMLEKGYPERPKEDLLASLVALRVDTFETNSKQHERKAKLWGVTLAALTVGLVLSAMAIVETGHHGKPGPGTQQPATSRPTATPTPTPT